jgi:hypothetical protein
VYVRLDEKCHLCPILTKTGIGRHILVKIANVDFHENPSTESRSVARGIRQADKTKLMSLFAVLLHTRYKIGIYRPI